MNINRGKQFEQKLKEQFEKIKDISIDRLYDVTTGYVGQNNICDFIVFDNGTLNYFECKAIHGNCLNFKSHIRDNQWQGLLKKSNIPKVNAGIICWFVDLDVTFFIDIKYLECLKASNKKSFNAKKFIGIDLLDENDLYWEHRPDDIPLPQIREVLLIEGKKKKVFFEYDLKDFLWQLQYDWIK